MNDLRKRDRNSREMVAAVYHSEWRRVLATLIRLLAGGRPFTLWGRRRMRRPLPLRGPKGIVVRAAMQQTGGLLLGDFDRAEDTLHDAFTSAWQQWTRDGVPANPRAWLVSSGRFKAIDGLRRRARFDASLAVLAEQIEANVFDHPPACSRAQYSLECTSIDY